MFFSLLLFTFYSKAESACDSRGGKVCIQIINKCNFPIWPGIQAQKETPSPSGFKLDPQQNREIQVPDGWVAGRIWARRDCDAQFNCQTGFCGNALECNGKGGEPPASLAEFTLNGAGGQDYYDVSLVDGYNLPLLIEPIEGTFNSNGGQFDCKRAGGCVQDLNDPKICPKELQKVVNGKVVGCKSACIAFNNDKYCCRGANSTPETCKSTDWPTNYPAIFKKACPTAYSFAYDDHTSTFTCRGKDSKSPEYRVQFC